MTTTNARISDPATSLVAGERHEASGKAETHRIRCEMAVFCNPGMTAKTIAKIADVERHEASRRLPELRDDNTVRHCISCSLRWEHCDPKMCLSFGCEPETVDGQLRWYSARKDTLF